MDSREVRDLMEAYLDVYAPQEFDEATAMAKRGYDETKLRKRAGGGEAADRATALEKRPTYGDKNKEAQRSRYARAQRGDFRNTASSNPGLHGYAHQSNDPKVKAKQAARGAQRGALTPNERKQLNMGDEFQNWVEALLDEGYDLSDYTWDELKEIYVSEARAEGVKPYKGQPLKPLPQAKPLSGERGSGEGYGDISKFKQDTDANKFKPGVDVPKVKTFGRISRVMPPSISGHATKTISANTRTRGGDAGAPRSQKIAPEVKNTKMVKKDGKWVKEAYDIVLAHLVSEGYANDFDSARKIMVNMSEEWRDSILDEGKKPLPVSNRLEE